MARSQRTQALVSNTPVGTAKGIFPGRVSWAYNPNAAKWTGAGTYNAAQYNPQAEYDKTFTAALQSLSGGLNDSDSWNKIFHWFNDNHGRPGTGYVAGDKITIKINQNNTGDYGNNDPGNNMNTNPQSAFTVIRSLVKAGVPQADITISDPSRAITNNIYNPIKAAYPNVIVEDYLGQNGRAKASFKTGAFLDNPDNLPNGQALSFYNARYLINQALLKGHDRVGVTLCAKNYFGTIGIDPMWWKKGYHPDTVSLRGFMTLPNFGGKTVLWMMDAMYPAADLQGAPEAGWAEAPFNGKPASSFFLSLDGIAVDAVAFDFFYQHHAAALDQPGWGGLDHTLAYMLNSAKGGFGVYEHWNNNVDRQYSRNLNPATGKGIELVKADPTTASIESPKTSVRKVSTGSFDALGRRMPAGLKPNLVSGVKTFAK